MDLTYAWSFDGYTPQHRGIFRVYLKATLTMLIYLPIFSLCEPEIWPKIGKSLVHSTKFRSDVWVLFKMEFQSDYQSKGTHRNTYTPKMKTLFNWTLLRQSAKFAMSACTFSGCSILPTLTKHRSKRPSLSRPKSSIDIVHQEVNQSSLLFKLITERFRFSWVSAMHLAASLTKKIETSAFIAIRVAAKDLFWKKKNKHKLRMLLNNNANNSDQCPGPMKSGVTVVYYGGAALNSPPYLQSSILYFNYSLCLLGVGGKDIFFFPSFLTFRDEGQL